MISMYVVPVLIKLKDSLKEIITHTIIDGCSQGTFIVEDLVSALEIDATDRMVKMLYGQSRLKSKLINRLAVSNLCEKKSWIKELKINVFNAAVCKFLCALFTLKILKLCRQKLSCLIFSR